MCELCYKYLLICLYIYICMYVPTCISLHLFSTNCTLITFERTTKGLVWYYISLKQAKLPCAKIQGLWAAKKWAEQSSNFTKSRTWALLYGSPPVAQQIFRSNAFLPSKLYRTMRGDLKDIRFDKDSFETAERASLDLRSAVVMAVAKGSTYSSPFLHCTASREQAENWYTAGSQSYGDPILLLL